MTEPVTHQSVFNMVARHLIEQGQASSDGKVCLYRHTLSDGRVLKCAAGFLIPDEAYTPSLERQIVDSRNDVWRCIPLEIRQLDDAENFIRGLQQAHDKTQQVYEKEPYAECIRIGLRDVAFSYGLDTSILDEVQA